MITVSSVDWNNYMREIYTKYLILQPKRKIRGSGLIFGIDEDENNADRVLPHKVDWGSTRTTPGNKAPSFKFIFDWVYLETTTMLSWVTAINKIAVWQISDCDLRCIYIYKHDTGRQLKYLHRLTLQLYRDSIILLITHLKKLLAKLNYKINLKLKFAYEI